MTRPSPLVIAIGAVSLLAGTLASGAALASSRVTALSGEARIGDAALSQHGEIPLDQPIEAAPGARCSFLMADENAVVQFCNQARLRVRDDEARDARILELNQGELKATVQRRSADAPLEVHTPAAIATILGTVLHVRVDAESGETVVTSLESRVHVASSDPRLPGGVVLEPGDQVTIRSGEPPGPVREIDPAALEGLGDCPTDEEFHAIALRRDRDDVQDQILDRVTRSDIPDTLPAVAAGPPRRQRIERQQGERYEPDACISGRCFIDERSTSRGGSRSLGPRPCSSDRVPGEQCLF